VGLVLFIITYLSHPISTFWRWDETCRSPPHMRAMDGPSLGSNAAWKILLGIVCSLPFSSMKMAIYGGISVFPISDKKHIMSCWTNVRSVSHLYLRIGCLNPIYISKKAPCFNHPIFSPQKNSNIPQNHVVFDIACWYPYSITIYIPWYCHSPLYGELYIPVLQVGSIVGAYVATRTDDELRRELTDLDGLQEGCCDEAVISCYSLLYPLMDIS
jgi:hypothetical protein